MSDERQQLGARLREARDYLGLSQEEAAQALGLPRPAISLIEAGRRRVDALELKRFARLYRRPVAELAGEPEYEAPRPVAIEHLARTASSLTENDQAELLRFAEFLKSRATHGQEE